MGRGAGGTPRRALRLLADGLGLRVIGQPDTGTCGRAGVERALAQRAEVQAEGVDRLAQVVAGSGQETGFVAVGLLGGLLGREGALRFGAQLVHQPVVFQLERNAAPYAASKLDISAQVISQVSKSN